LCQNAFGDAGWLEPMPTQSTDDSGVFRLATRLRGPSPVHNACFDADGGAFPSHAARMASISGFLPMMFITRVRL
jgi:hypothetical protein